MTYIAYSTVAPFYILIVDGWLYYMWLGALSISFSYFKGKIKINSFCLWLHVSTPIMDFNIYTHCIAKFLFITFLQLHIFIDMSIYKLIIFYFRKVKYT